jgi:hypothetical protein
VLTGDQLSAVIGAIEDMSSFDWLDVRRINIGIWLR